MSVKLEPALSVPISQAFEVELYFSTLPFATPVVSTLPMSFNELIVVPVLSTPGAQALPVHLSTSPAFGAVVLTSVKPDSVVAPPPPPPPLTVVNVKLPEPSVVSTCPFVPSVAG